MIAIGDVENKNLEHFQEWDWLIFFICAIFNIIILMNLLIAIISETYVEYERKKDETEHLEKVRQTLMLQDMLYYFRKKVYSASDMLFVAQVVKHSTSEDDLSKADVFDQMEEIREQLHEVTDQLFELKQDT